jgi:hypothetical protein
MHDQHSESSVEKTVGIELSFEKTNFINPLGCDIPHKWQMSPQISNHFLGLLFLQTVRQLKPVVCDL